MTIRLEPPRRVRAAPFGRINWALVAAGLSIAAPAVAGDWPTPGLDAAHTRLSAERSGAGFADGQWSFVPSMGAGALASPVASDGYVITATLDGTVRALAGDSGSPVWQVSLGASVQGTPAIANGRVFIPTLGGTITALGLADGQRLWSTAVGGLNVSSPAIVNGDVVCGAGLPSTSVVRLDGTTGAIVWQSPPGMEEFSNTAPAVGDGLVVVGTNGGHYYAFNATTGLPRWDYRADGVVNVSAPLIAAGHVYLAGGGQSDRVHALDVTTGAPLAGWPIVLPTPDPDLNGTLIDRTRSVSSFAWAAGLVVMETRLDDSLDTDGDGLADKYLSRESVLALGPESGTIAWQRPIARVVFETPNDIPAFVVCPTPAAFTAKSGAALLAVGSSLAATGSILEAANGTDDADLKTVGRALASPMMANGRLFTLAENGTIEARLSSVNHPPAAPMPAANPQPLDAADVTLRWAASMDPDGDQPSYELRIDSDGEVLETYAQQVFPARGATSVTVVAPFTPGVTYTFALRARDPEGALSPWSALETFTVAASGAVTVNGTPAVNLRTALAGAQPGDLILLRTGTFPVSNTLHVGAGVTLKGAGAGRTLLDATGQSTGVSFDATDPKLPSVLDGATVTGAATCVSVSGTATGVRLSHLIVHDCATSGIAVATGGGAAIVNATVVANGVGVDAGGTASIKNSLVTRNDVGLKGDSPAALTSSYDDLFANTADYQGLTAGNGDLAASVTFANAPNHDYSLTGPQASTDEGDPVDDVGAEPTPNGARINLGAFGGTADAELSAPAAVVDGGNVPPASVTPPAVAPASGQTTSANDQAGGCAIGGGSPEGLALLGLAIAIARLRGRPRRQGRDARN